MALKCPLTPKKLWQSTDRLKPTLDCLFTGSTAAYKELRVTVIPSDHTLIQTQTWSRKFTAERWQDQSIYQNRQNRFTPTTAHIRVLQPPLLLLLPCCCTFSQQPTHLLSARVCSLSAQSNSSSTLQANRQGRAQQALEVWLGGPACSGENRQRAITGSTGLQAAETGRVKISAGTRRLTSADCQWASECVMKYIQTDCSRAAVYLCFYLRLLIWFKLFSRVLTSEENHKFCNISWSDPVMALQSCRDWEVTRTRVNHLRSLTPLKTLEI